MYGKVMYACIIAAGLLLSCASNAEWEADRTVGEFSAPRELERGMTILPNGRYGVRLFGKGANAAFIIFREDPETRLTYSYGVETTVSASAPGPDAPAFQSSREGTGDDERIVLRFNRGGFQYLAFLPLYSDKPPVPYERIQDSGAALAETEIAKIAETFELLDSHAARIWPGWLSWKKIDVLAGLPDGCTAVATSRTRLPHNLRPVKGMDIGGRGVYIDASGKRETYLPAKLHGRHGGGDVTGISVSIIPFDGDNPDPRYQAMKDFEIITIYMHEAFHCEQALHAVRGKAVGKEADPSRLSPETLSCLQVEGEALMSAYAERDDGNALACMKEAFAMRKRALSLMPAAAAQNYRWKTLNEGTATYVEARAAMLIDSVPARDYLSMALETEPRGRMDAIAESSGYGQLPYCYGMFWCLLLDRFMPDWKNGLFKSADDMDDRLESLLLTP